MISEKGLIRCLGGLVGGEHVFAGAKVQAYAVDEKFPTAVVTPGSVEEVSAVMGFASGEGLKVAPWGSGTKMAFGGVPERLDLVISLSRLTGVVDNEPADMTATFQAGTLLREAQARLGQTGQFIALDPPHSQLATIGGILATNSSGPRRLRFGSSRDLLIAIRVVHADGTVTKGGAKVVKNVTGYDINKLYLGSLGTLGIIVEATFRLFPVLAVEKTFLAPFASVEEVGGVVAKILNSPLVPSAIELFNPEASQQLCGETRIPWPEDNYGLAVAIGSVRREAVDAQLEAAGRYIGEAVSHDKCILEGETHDVFWQLTRDFAIHRNLQAILKASVLFTKVADAVKLGDEIAKKQGMRIGIISEAGSGIIRYYLSGRNVAPEKFHRGVVEAVKQLRQFAVAADGSLVVLEAPPETKREVDIWGAVGNALPLMKGLKEQFDPERILNPGRFVGGI
ncbi:MAG: FAD-binding oxidoreductase [Candidatus Binatia bacterium]